MTPREGPPAARAAQLLSSIKDVAPPGHPAARSIGGTSDPFRPTFEQYVNVLRQAKQRGDAWFSGLVEGVMEREGQERAEAEAAVRLETPLAPASHTAVVGTIRTFWLKCAEMNEAVPPADRVAPEQFILGWLIETGADDLVEMVSQLTYFPVGLDENGQWV